MANTTITPSAAAVTAAGVAAATFTCLGVDNAAAPAPISAPYLDPFHAAAASDLSAFNAAGDSQAVIFNKLALLIPALLGIGAASLPSAQYTEDPNPTPRTLQAAEFVGSKECTINMTATLGGAGTLTTPTAAAILAAWPNAVAGQSYVLNICNTSGANAWTLTAGSGVTITGTATINAGAWRRFLVTMVSASAVSIQSMAMTGTAS